MNKFDLFLFIWLVRAACCAFTVIEPSASVAKNATIGSFSYVGQGAKIRSNSNVGPFVNISARVTIESGCDIKSYVKVGPYTTIGNNAVILSYANIGNGNVIGRNCRVNGFVSTDSSVIIEDNVLIDMYAHVGDSVEVKNGCILAKYASVGPNSLLNEEAYIGDYCEVGQNAAIGRRAVLQKFAKIPDGKQLEDGTVVIPTPSSYSLYELAVPSNNLRDLNLAELQTNDSEFHRLINEQLTQEINYIREQCRQPVQGNKIQFNLLGQMISLYLVKFYGLKDFDKCFKEVTSGMSFSGNNRVIYNNQVIVVNNNVVTINGVRYQGSCMEKLQNEYHFAGNLSSAILSPEQIKNFVRLLAIKDDNQRQYRVKNDEPFRMIEKILFELPVKCDVD